MLYVILGILILIVSFVVALISLVYEQRKVEERTIEEDAESGLVEDDAVEVAGTPELVSTPQVVLNNTIEPLPISSFSPSQNTVDDKLDVWWDKIPASDAAEKNIPQSSDEEESIAQIRRELAKLTGGKGATVPTPSKSDEKPPVDDELVEPSRMDTKRRNLLMGEFSLGDIKKRD